MVVQMSEQLVLRTPPEEDAGVVYPPRRRPALVRYESLLRKTLTAVG